MESYKGIFKIDPLIKLTWDIGTADYRWLRKINLPPCIEVNLFELSILTVGISITSFLLIFQPVTSIPPQHPEKQLYIPLPNRPQPRLHLHSQMLGQLRLFIDQVVLFGRVCF